MSIEGDEKILSSIVQRSGGTLRSVLQKIAPEADHLSRHLSLHYQWSRICADGSDEMRPIPVFMKWHRASFVSRQLLKAECLMALEVIRKLDKITAQPFHEELVEWSSRLEEEGVCLLQQSSPPWTNRESMLEELRHSIKESKALVIGYDRLCRSCSALFSLLSNIDDIYQSGILILTTRIMEEETGSRQGHVSVQELPTW